MLESIGDAQGKKLSENGVLTLVTVNVSVGRRRFLDILVGLIELALLLF